VTSQPNPGQGFQDLATALGDRGQRQGLFDRCMTSKGYRKATADEKQEIDKRQAKTEELRYRGRVGFRVAPQVGALTVTKIAPGGPAERAGVLPGDVLTKVGGIAVNMRTDPQDLADMLTGVPGSKVMVTLLRNGEEKEIVLIREVLSEWGR
jgi:C-terminal processing protease CtpA/Prc